MRPNVFHDFIGLVGTKPKHLGKNKNIKDNIEEPKPGKS